MQHNYTFKKITYLIIFFLSLAACNDPKGEGGRYGGRLQGSTEELLRNHEAIIASINALTQKKNEIIEKIQTLNQSTTTTTDLVKKEITRLESQKKALEDQVTKLKNDLKQAKNQSLNLMLKIEGVKNEDDLDNVELKDAEGENVKWEASSGTFIKASGDSVVKYSELDDDQKQKYILFKIGEYVKLDKKFSDLKNDFQQLQSNYNSLKQEANQFVTEAKNAFDKVEKKIDEAIFKLKKAALDIHKSKKDDLTNPSAKTNYNTVALKLIGMIEKDSSITDKVTAIKALDPDNTSLNDASITTIDEAKKIFS